MRGGGGGLELMIFYEESKSKENKMWGGGEGVWS